MRSVIFRFGDRAKLAAHLEDARGSLTVPDGEAVNEGEWILAIFEIGSRPPAAERDDVGSKTSPAKTRTTAAAARGAKVAGAIKLVFERRDWDRLVGYVAARSEHMRAARPVSSVPPTSSAKVPVAMPVVPDEPPTSRRGRNSDAPPRSRRLEELPSTSALESSRLPFGSHVLLVDVEGAAEADLRAVLSEMGLVVDFCKNTKAADERILAQSFDAIVIDLRAEGSDPRGFMTRVRARAEVADVPVLFLSSKPTARDVVEAFACGADDFLPKPFRTTELAARIFGLLRRASLARSAAGG